MGLVRVYGADVDSEPSELPPDLVADGLDWLPLVCTVLQTMALILIAVTLVARL